MAEAVLGKDGLAGKADRHVDFANSQRDKLFPSAKSMLGGEMTVTGLYTGKTLQHISNYTNIGNLLNISF
jgi:hypothetical protein